VLPRMTERQPEGSHITPFCYGLLLVCAKCDAEALVATTREIGLEISADATKYMVMSRDQNAG